MSLFDINREIVETFENCINEETGEINEELYQKLNDLKIERNDKIENIACWIKDLVADANAIKEESKKMAARAKAYENKAENLKGYLKAVLAGEKFSTSKVAISYRKTSHVECDDDLDITSLPQEFWKYGKPEPKKTEIAKYLKEGNELTGCKIVEDTSMSIR